MTPHGDRVQATTVLDRPWVRLAGWSVFLVLTLRLLHGETFGSLSIPLGSLDELAAWTEHTSPVVMAVAVVRLTALAAAWYLAAATVLTVVAALTRWRPLATVAVWVSPHIVRRLVSRSASAGLAVGALLAATPLPPRLAASPAVAEAAPRDPTPAASATTSRSAADDDPRPAGGSPATTTSRPTSTDRDDSRPAIGDPPPTDSTLPTATMTRVPDPTDPVDPLDRADPNDPTDPADPVDPVDTAGPRRSAPEPSSPGPPADGERAESESWVVEPGDSFWSIAEETLADADGSTVSPAAIVRYCDRLIRANRDRLVDRTNPDLLVPGQELSIPPAS